MPRQAVDGAHGGALGMVVRLRKRGQPRREMRTGTVYDAVDDTANSRGSSVNDARRTAAARTPARWKAAAGALALLAAGAAAAAEFTDPHGKFSATFPAEPSLDRQEGTSISGGHTHFTWEVDQAGRHFSVTYTEYKVAPVKNYDKNVMGMLTATQGKLLRQAKIELEGLDGREVYTQLPDNNVMRQRIFQTGNRLYQAVYVGPFGTESRADVRTFMESFRLAK